MAGRAIGKAKLVLAAVLAVLVLIVIFQNTEQVTVKLLFASVTMPQALMLLVTLGIGVVLGGLLLTWRRWR